MNNLFSLKKLNRFSKKAKKFGFSFRGFAPNCDEPEIICRFNNDGVCSVRINGTTKEINDFINKIKYFKKTIILKNKMEALTASICSKRR